MLFLLETPITFVSGPHKYLVNDNKLDALLKNVIIFENDSIKIHTPDPRERTCHQILAKGKDIFDILNQTQTCDTQDEWLCCLKNTFDGTNFLPLCSSFIQGQQSVSLLQRIVEDNKHNNDFEFSLYRKIYDNYILIFSTK